MDGDNSSRLSPQLRSHYMSCSCAWVCCVAITLGLGRLQEQQKPLNKKQKRFHRRQQKDWRTNRTAGFLLRKMPPPPISRSRLFPSLSRHQEDTKRNEKRGDKTRASYIQHKWALSAKKKNKHATKKKQATSGTIDGLCLPALRSSLQEENTNRGAAQSDGQKSEWDQFDSQLNEF